MIEICVSLEVSGISYRIDGLYYCSVYPFVAVYRILLFSLSSPVYAFVCGVLYCLFFFRLFYFLFFYYIQFLFHRGLTCFVVQFVFQSWFIKDLVCCSVCPLMLSTHAPYVCIWLCMKWRNMVHDYMMYTERAKTTAVSHGTSHVTTKQCCTYTTSVNIQNAL